MKLQNLLLMILVGNVVLAISSLNNGHAIGKSGYEYYQKLTGDDADQERVRWDRFYKKSKGYSFGTEPAHSLVENIKLLPLGRALDVAMGEGRNSVYLAKKGFQVEGVDISAVGIQKAKRLARTNQVHIKALVSDLNRYKITENSYDVILVFYYLQRSLTKEIIKGLKKGGVVFYETFTVDHLKYDKGINPQFLLNRNELKTMFPDFEILKYEEEDNGKHAIARLIAKRK